MLTLGLISLILGTVLILVVNPALHYAHFSYRVYTLASNDPEVSDEGRSACRKIAKRYKFGSILYHVSRMLGFFLIGLGASLLVKFIPF